MCVCERKGEPECVCEKGDARESVRKRNRQTKRETNGVPGERLIRLTVSKQTLLPTTRNPTEPTTSLK